MDDAIKQAGGLSEQASTKLLQKAINRAQKINDGAKIYIPQKGDEDTSHNIVSGGETGQPNTSHNIIIEKKGSDFISINSGAQSELESLPGVGPATAAKIINGRPYTSLDELIRKKAVGQKLFEKIKSQLTL